MRDHGFRSPADDLLTNTEMVAGESCNLRKMRYAQHLVLFGNLPQALPDGFRHSSADACVHFIEHKGLVFFFTPAQRLDGKHQPG